MVERTYRIAGDVSAEAITAEVASAWDALRKDPLLRERVGVDMDSLLHASPEDAIVVRAPMSGFAAETIVIAFLPLAVKIASDVWEKLILPRIVRRFGVDSLVEVPNTDD